MNIILFSSSSISSSKINFRNSSSSTRGQSYYTPKRYNSTYITSLNATTQQPIEKFAVDDEKSIAEKAALARTAQEQWSFLPLHTRRQHLSQLKSHFQTHLNELATLLTNENGKPISQSKNEVNGTVKRFDYFLQNSQRVLEDHAQPIIADSTVVEKLAYEPIGVVGNIGAWNYPLFTGLANVIFPALLAGNAVMYKPSEFVISTGKMMIDLVAKALPDPNLLQLVVGGGDVGSKLINVDLENGEHAIDAVFFTGSKNTGIKIASEAGKRLIKTQLELGGKDGIYVAEDVDIPKAAAAIADGAFYNNGQGCCSVERVYVNKMIYNQFVEEVVKNVKSFKMGDPLNSDVYLGPLTRPSHASFLVGQVNDAVAKGAKLLHGGKNAKVADFLGTFFEPTVLVDCSSEMEVMREETFGPIIALQSVESDEDAVAELNNCEYGLTNGIYCKSKERSLKILKQLQCGTAYWNCCDRVSPALPWSGRKASGIGATLGDDGIRAFVVPKAYHLNFNFFDN